MNLPYKFIVSGSGSLELKEKIHESLAGRKRIFFLPTVTFTEFVNFKTAYKYENKLIDFFSIEKDKTKYYLEEYLQFGGYPRVLLKDTQEEKEHIIEEIYQSYLEKDISYLLNIRKTEAFTNLVRLLSSQTGNIINLTELSSTLGISIVTVKEYLWYLEKTFIVQRVSPFFRNIRKEITKSPMIYFNDLGLRNYASSSFGRIPQSPDTGFLFQNFIFRLLSDIKKETVSTLHYWRTKDGAEIDCIIDQGQKQIPIEVKYQTLNKFHISRALRSFIQKYQPEKAYIIYPGDQDADRSNRHNLERQGKTKISAIPFYKLYTENLFGR